MSDKSETHEIRYPFHRGTFIEEDYDGRRESPTWNVGPLDVRDQYGQPTYVAHGWGKMLIKVVSRHKPGKYPERIFYTRQWEDPDGKQFGKTCLRITTAQRFKRLISGFGLSVVSESAQGGNK